MFLGFKVRSVLPEVGTCGFGGWEWNPQIGAIHRACIEKDKGTR